VDPGQGTYDRDLDSTPSGQPRPRNESIAPYQRVVVNPFLAVLALVITFAYLRWVIEHGFTGFLELGFALLALDLFLIQYHCRDCGATGWLLRVQKHVCPAVLARWHLGERPRFRGPGVRAQLVSWFILLMSALVLALVACSGG
jgi:hypothetical protein